MFLFTVLFVIFYTLKAQEISFNRTLILPQVSMNHSILNMDQKLIKASSPVAIDHKISIIHPTSEEEIPEARATLNSFIKYTSSLPNNTVIVMDYLILMPRKAINRTDFCISKAYSPKFRIK